MFALSLPKISKSKSNVSILSSEDYERIKQNARRVSVEESKNRQMIMAQQRESQLAKARAHLERLRAFDKKRPRFPLSENEKEKEKEKSMILLSAKEAKEASFDLSKKMDQLLKYAKIVSVRDIQKKEMKQLDAAFKKKEEKLDLIMELERLKGLKAEEEKKILKHKKRLEDAKVLEDQIKEKEFRKIQEKEFIQKEGEKIKKHIVELEEADLLLEEKKKQEKLNMAKEIVSMNQISALEKEKKRREEKENDLKILKYNMEKAKKEEEEILEKRRIQIEKEKETQKLREMQEKISDKQAILDELRAKRAFEDNEKKEREKKRLELIKFLKQKQELIEGNEVQKITKQNKLHEQAISDEKEYEEIVKHQIAEMEEEKRLNEIRKKTLDANGQEVLRQIQEKREKEKLYQRAVLEEGRILKQNQDEYRRTMERIKQQKLDEMEKFNIKPLYRVDLQKLKID